jgi:hypothetical protein
MHSCRRPQHSRPDINGADHDAWVRGRRTAIDCPSLYVLGQSILQQPRLSVEVRITDQSCGRSFLAETRISQGGTVIAQTLPIAVPICGTTGDILVLKNLVPDTTLALPK